MRISLTMFQTWKTESAPEWNFKDLYAAGLVPKGGGKSSL